jgi:DNA-binding response OmpR family regulator
MTATAATVYHENPRLTADLGRLGAVVLVAEESNVERRHLAENLAADRYTIRCADCREKALAVLGTDPPVDIAVIDVNGQTLDLIDAVRSGDGLAGRVDPQVPILVLTSRVEELDRIRLLDRGGDDVLARPYSYPELRARVAALLRRADARRAPWLLRAGTLAMDLASRTVRVAGHSVKLTGTEYALLRTLVADPGRVFTRAELLATVWGMHTSSRTVDSHVHRLRRKLTAAGSDAQIELIWGVGYRVQVPGHEG